MSSCFANRHRAIRRMTAVFASATMFGLGLAGVLSGGGKSSAAPSPAPQPQAAPSPAPSPAVPSIVRLRIDGPASIAPRGNGVSVVQFTATATRADGSSDDVTATAKWNASRYAIVHPTGRPGEMQAESRGEAVIEASAGGVNAELPVLVLEVDTFKVSGAITDVATGERLEGVRVTN